MFRSTHKSSSLLAGMCGALCAIALLGLLLSVADAQRRPRPKGQTKTETKQQLRDRIKGRFEKRQELVDQQATQDAMRDVAQQMGNLRGLRASLLDALLGSVTGNLDWSEDSWNQGGLADELGDWDDYDSDGERMDAVDALAWKQSSAEDLTGKSWDDYASDAERRQDLQDKEREQQNGEDADDDNGDDDGDDAEGIIGTDPLPTPSVIALAKQLRGELARTRFQFTQTSSRGTQVRASAALTQTRYIMAVRLGTRQSAPPAQLKLRLRRGVRP